MENFINVSLLGSYPILSKIIIQTLQFKLYNSNSTLLELAMFSGYPAECIEKGKKVIVKLIKL